MHIIVNGQEAAIKVGSTFEYTQENRLFTEAEGYSLEIEFPLKGCVQNQLIFGLQNLIVSGHKQKTYQCVLMDVNFYKSGYLTVTGANDVCLKAQFLEGASASNMMGSSIDNIYINEVKVLEDSERFVVLTNPWLPGTNMESHDGLITLPWVNNYSGNIQNEPESMTNPTVFKNPGVPSFQIYLINYIERLSAKTGIHIELPGSFKSKYSSLVIFNATPSAWFLDDICYAMPHWTIREFLDQLAYFSGGIFKYDASADKCVYQSAADFMAGEPVDLENVVDAYEMEVSDNAAKNYAGAISLKYAECSHRLWKYYSCQWLVDLAERTGQVIEGNEKKMQSLVAEAEGKLQIQDPEYWNYAKYKNAGYHQWTDLSKLVRESKTGRYWMVVSHDVYESNPEFTMNAGNGDYKKRVHAVRRSNIRYREINRFGPAISPEEGAEEKEIGIVPVWVDDCDGSQMAFLEHGEYGSDESSLLPLHDTLEGGEQDDSVEYLDKMYVGFFGSRYNFNNVNGYLYPSTDGLSLKAVDASVDEVLPRVDPNKKYKVKFICKGDVPPVESIFLIGGKRFLCQQLSTTFTTDGRSQLVKGEFFLIVD